jgi:hypothetical protein
MPFMLTDVRKRVAVVVAAFCGCSISSFAWSQEAEESAASQPEPITADEEVIVRGRTLESLREQIREAEVAYFDRFNEINSDDEFDIHCYYRVEIGSKIPRRRCLPNFWREKDANIGEETARQMQGSYAINPQFFVAEQQYKSHQLTEEMQRLTAEDDELLADVTRLANLKETLEVGKGVERETKSTIDREVHGVDGKLAFDAKAVFQVHIGRKPWTHDLTQRTFTIARVYGEIRDIQVECDERDARLDQQIGVEWTLPDSWGACRLVVDAKRDTTFALYEFG